MRIKPAFPNEFNAIKAIAEATWPATYASILPHGQIAYMLGMMYSIAQLNHNYEQGVRFVLAEQNARYFGFAGFEHNASGSRNTHIHKIYVLPEAQGKNVGRLLMDYIEEQARTHEAEALTLNVNRHNKARGFYENLGFEILESVDIAIGNGFVMEDYIMIKRL